MTIRFQKANYAHKGVLATAEIHFSGGPLDGLRLVGFTVTQDQRGSRQVVAPSRNYSVNGERRAYALLRPVNDHEAWERFTGVVLDAFRLWEQSEVQDEVAVPG